MVNTELLLKTIEDSGMSISNVCKRAGIMRNTFYKKVENPTTFRVDDIDGLTYALKLNNSERDRIFFAKNVQ